MMSERKVTPRVDKPDYELHAKSSPLHSTFFIGRVLPGELWHGDRESFPSPLPVVIDWSTLKYSGNDGN